MSNLLTWSVLEYRLFAFPEYANICLWLSSECDVVPSFHDGPHWVPSFKILTRTFNLSYLTWIHIVCSTFCQYITAYVWADFLQVCVNGSGSNWFTLSRFQTKLNSVLILKGYSRELCFKPQPRRTVLPSIVW